MPPTRPKLCGATSTSMCVFPPRHEGLCSYWADSELNKQLTAEVQRLTEELAQARAEIERARQQKVTDDELYRRCDQRWLDAEQRLKQTQAERDAALAVVEAAGQMRDADRARNEHVSDCGDAPCDVCEEYTDQLIGAEVELDQALAAFDKARQGGRA